MEKMNFKMTKKIILSVMFAITLLFSNNLMAISQKEQVESENSDGN